MGPKDLAVGVGLALALEGLVWAAWPGLMRRALARIEAAPDVAVRVAALLALAAGVGIVWAAKAFR